MTRCKDCGAQFLLLADFRQCQLCRESESAKAYWEMVDGLTPSQDAIEMPTAHYIQKGILRGLPNHDTLVSAAHREATNSPMRLSKSRVRSPKTIA